MAAAVIGSGVVKSGSPIVRLMTSFISLSMSKKRRMPDGGIDRTRSLRKSAGARRVAGWLLIVAESSGWRPPPRHARSPASIRIGRRFAGHGSEQVA